MSAASAPLRITVVVPVAAPYREPLFAGLDAREDIELTVVYADATQSSWDVPDDYFQTAHPYPAVHLRSRQLPRPGRTPVMFPSGLERALATSRPEVIVASEYGPTAIRSRLWAGAHAVPHLLFTECTPEIDALLPAAQLRWHRHFAQNTDGAIAVSSAARQRLLDFGLAPERVTVSLQSADLASIRAARDAARPDAARPDTARPDTARPGAPRPAAALPGPETTSRDPLRVVTVGRLVPDKNVALLMRALRQAATDLAPRRVVLDVVGDGFLRAQLAATASELGIDATFHGHLGGEAVAHLYARADLFALLSGYEPFGVVIREAAAAGLPILTTDVVGAVGDVAIDGENAIVIRPSDLSGAAVALRRLLSEDALRAAMSQASRAIDAATAGSEVTAFAGAVRAAADRT